MDLVLLSSSLDAIAIKCGSCLTCVEKKLDTTVLRVFPKQFTPTQFKLYEAEHGLKGYRIDCFYGNYNPHGSIFRLCLNIIFLYVKIFLIEKYLYKNILTHFCKFSLFTIKFNRKKNSFVNFYRNIARTNKIPNE